MPTKARKGQHLSGPPMQVGEHLLPPVAASPPKTISQHCAHKTGYVIYREVRGELMPCRRSLGEQARLEARGRGAASS